MIYENLDNLTMISSKEATIRENLNDSQYNNYHLDDSLFDYDSDCEDYLINGENNKISDLNEEEEYLLLLKAQNLNILKTTAFEYYLNNLRDFAIDNMYSINNKLNLENFIFFKAVSILDYYISKLSLDQIKNFENNLLNLKLISVICLNLSLKTEKIEKVMTLTLIKKIFSNELSTNEIIKTEKQILMKINFKLNFLNLETSNNLILNLLKQKFNNLNFDLEETTILKNLNKSLILIPFIKEFSINIKTIDKSIISILASIYSLVESENITINEFEDILNEIYFYLSDQLNLLQINKNDFSHLCFLLYKYLNCNKIV